MPLFLLSRNLVFIRTVKRGGTNGPECFPVLPFSKQSGKAKWRMGRLEIYGIYEYGLHGPYGRSVHQGIQYQ